MIKFRDLNVTFKKKKEIAILSAITAAGILVIGTILYGVDTGVASIFSIIFA